MSQEFNSDAEGWELTDKFGDRSLRIWIEILAILDRNKNNWKLVNGWDSVMSRKVRQTPARCRLVLGHLLATQWLMSRQQAADDPSVVLYAPNFAKFHKLRSEASPPPNHPNLSEPNLKEEDKKKKAPAVPFSLPDWIRKDAWDGFEESRKKSRHPMTNHAKDLIISKLKKFKDEGLDPNAILDQSTLNGWQDVFPPRSDNNHHHSNQPQAPYPYRTGALAKLKTLRRPGEE